MTGGNYPTADLLFSGPMKRCLETAQILYPGQTPILSRSGRRWISVHLKDTIIRNFPGIRHIRDGSTAAVHCHFRKARAERNSFAETLPDMKNVILHENDLERSAASEQGDYNTGSEKTELERSDEIGAQDAGIQSVSAVVHGGTIMALLSHFTGENILTIRQNADRVTAVFWYSRWEGSPGVQGFSPTVKVWIVRIYRRRNILMKYHILAFGAGFLLDQLFGDPYFLPHPIRGIGWLIAKTEKTLRAGNPQGNSTERGGGAQTGKTSGGDRFTVYGNAVGTDFIRCLCDASGTGSGHRSGHDLPDSGGEVSSGGEQQGVETIERREPGGSQKSGIHDRRQGHGTSDRGRRGKGGH